ncbi:ABC transporter substrate-binding protein [Geobacillus subterraneus]|uniref:ABC transporter substrate-binding protein n=1 Tax=Geobacillus subterraneus TaxID=129338 RepID=UPI002AC8B1F0|nr:ABC transporter substrate-binding protein [Geobacillus subterraneus]WPZ17085.1 ABC transporter substrate-binding protein [Geobacillus subterraneus]
MKKWWKGALAAVCTATMMMAVGCSSSSSGGNSSEGEGKVKIVWAHGKDDTAQSKKLIEAFNAKHQNIEVVELEMPQKSDAQHDDYVTKLAAGDTSIDVFSLDIIWPPEFGAAGWLEPLNDYFSKEDLEKLLPGPVEGTQYKGKQIAIPLYTDAGVLFYRKDILEKYGKQPPKTFEELMVLAKELQGKEGTKYGFVFQANQYEGLVCDWLEYVWANGGNVLDKDGNVVVNSPNTIEATKFMKELVDQVAPPGVTTYQEPESLAVFLEGKAVFHRNWPYAWKASSGPESKISGKVGVIPMPKGPKGTSGAATLGGWNLGINKNIDEEKKKAAAEFIKFAVSPEGQKIVAIEGGRLPVLKEMYKDEEVLKANPHFAEFFEPLMAAKPRPVSPNYPKISDAIQRNIHKVLTGGLSAEEAVANIEKEIKEIEK